MRCACAPIPRCSRARCGACGTSRCATRSQGPARAGAGVGAARRGLVLGLALADDPAAVHALVPESRGTRALPRPPRLHWRARFSSPRRRRRPRIRCSGPSVLATLGGRPRSLPACSPIPTAAATHNGPCWCVRPDLLARPSLPPFWSGFITRILERPRSACTAGTAARRRSGFPAAYAAGPERRRRWRWCCSARRCCSCSRR